LLRRELWQKLADVSEAIITFIIRMMEAAGSSETPVNTYQTTQCSIPEDSHRHTCRHHNLKSHKNLFSSLNKFV
jgi:hypothetical protein